MTGRTPKGDLERDLQDPECARLYKLAVARTEREYQRQLKLKRWWWWMKLWCHNDH